MKFSNFIYLKINPDFSENFLKDVQPILFVVALIAVILGFIKTLAKGDLSNIVVQIIVSVVVLALIKEPDMLLDLGKFIIDFIANVGRDLIE
jgi:hypothetical protein